MSEHTKQSRRTFMKNMGYGGTAVLLLSSGINGTECTETTVDKYGAGPFKLPNIPERTQIAPPDEPGERLKVSGVLYKGDCITPIPNATIEVWHADNTGCYNHPNSCGTGPDYHLYGKFKTGAQGEYAYDTILPARYLNGNRYRPRHIHYQITTEDNKSLITQLYFDGDPYIAGDLGASDPTAKNRIVPLTKDSSGTNIGVFDIVLGPVFDPVKIDKVKTIRKQHGLQIRQMKGGILFLAPFRTKKTYSLNVYTLRGEKINSWNDVRGDIYWEKGFSTQTYVAQLSFQGVKTTRQFRVSH